MNEKRILILAGFAESLIRFRGSLINAMQKQGLEVHVAAPELEEGCPLRLKMEALGIKVHNVFLVRTGTNPVSDIRTFFSFCRLIKKIRPEYVLSYTIKPVVYGSLAAWIVGVKHRFALITGLGYAFQGPPGKLQYVVQKLYSVALARVQKIFFQNPDDQALFRDRGLIKPSSASVIVNGSGVDVFDFSPTSIPRGETLFLLISRFLGNKGIREFALAAKRVKSLYPNVRFALVGWIDDNPDKISQEELDTWVTDGTLENWGYFPDVRQAIERCNIYVLPSYREGTPRTVLEAMAMGRAIITTDAPGCRETVLNGVNGFLVPIRDPEALAVAMLKFVELPELAVTMGAHSRRIAEEKYDVHAVNDVMLREMGLL